MIRKSIKYITFFLLLGIPLAHAGKEVGNGGDGIYYKGKLTLLDFVEHGIEDPSINSPTILPAISEYPFRKTIPVGIPKDLLYRKISEIYEANLQALAYGYLRVLDLYEIKFVDYPLANSEDENTAVRGELHQLALRLGSSILIQRELWNQLDDKNKIGLLIHELTFALIRPVKNSTGMIQRSEKVREICAFLFQKNWNERVSEFPQILEGLPLMKEVEFDSGSYFNKTQLYLNFEFDRFETKSYTSRKEVKYWNDHTHRYETRWEETTEYYDDWSSIPDYEDEFKLGAENQSPELICHGKLSVEAPYRIKNVELVRLRNELRFDFSQYSMPGGTIANYVSWNEISGKLADLNARLEEITKHVKNPFRQEKRYELTFTSENCVMNMHELLKHQDLLIWQK